MATSKTGTSQSGAAPSGVEYGHDTALIVVDVQNDFTDPEGSLYVKGGDDAVPLINQEIEAATQAGATVVYTQDWHPPETPHFVKDGGTWPVHCVRDSWGAELHPELKVVGDVVRKGTGGEDGYSGFMVRDPETGEETPTELGPKLRDRGVRRVVVVGLAGDVCVKETTLDAVRQGFGTTVIREATRSVNQEVGDEGRAFDEMREAGASVVR